MPAGKTIFVGVLLGMASFFSAFSQSFQPIIKTDWKAQWISLADSVGQNSWLCFRKTYQLDQIPAQVLASIAVDSKYWLWINGKQVVFEGQLKRGPTPKDTYYDEVNIRPYLKKGENTIAILVWYWGRDGFCHKNSGKAGLLFEAPVGEDVWISNTTWRVLRHPAFGFTGKPVPNFRLPEFNVHFDARADMAQPWFLENYSDQSWQNAVALGNAPCAPWNALWERPLPFWKDEGLRAYEDTILSVTALRDTQVVIGKLPRNSTVTPYLKVQAPAGLLIDIRTDNYKGGSEYNVRTEYITKEGIQEFETLAYMNGHEVRYALPKGVKVLSLQYRETRYQTEYVGYFRSNDDFYTTLWQKSVNTLNVNLRDAIQDPDRERAQWWGDVVTILGEMFYVCDSNGIPAIQKSISNLIEWQKPDSVLFSPVPAGNWDKELSAQMLASVGHYGIWRYFYYSADTSMVRYAYPAIRKYLALWQIGPDGLVVHRTGGWDWHDWGDKIDVPLLDNAWYYLALQGATQMARVIGKEADAVEYEQRMKIIKENFNRYFWQANGYKSASYAYGFDDRGNGLAVTAGLADRDKWIPIRDNVLQKVYHAGPYLEKYILEAFFQMNDPSAGLARMQRRYKDMVESPISTLWEGWLIGSGTYGGGTYNHGWSGGPLTLLSEYVAGIAPESPGYDKYHVLPQPGLLRQISCKTPTRKGDVVVTCQRTAKNWRMTVQSPKSTEAIMGIPKFSAQPYRKISLNGRLVWKKGKPGKMRPGIRYLGEDKQYYRFAVQPGRWKWKAVF